MKKFSSECFSRICSDKVIKIAGFICLMHAYSCTSALYIPTIGYETASASLADLEDGRKAYMQYCAACHTLYLPEKYSKEEWIHWVNEMVLKVPLKEGEKEQILKYVCKGK
jgi:hypothetical protein